MTFFEKNLRPAIYGVAIGIASFLSIRELIEWNNLNSFVSFGSLAVILYIIEIILTWLESPSSKNNFMAELDEGDGKLARFINIIVVPISILFFSQIIKFSSSDIFQLALIVIEIIIFFGLIKTLKIYFYEDNLNIIDNATIFDFSKIILLCYSVVIGFFYLTDNEFHNFFVLILIFLSSLIILSSLSSEKTEVSIKLKLGVYGALSLINAALVLISQIAELENFKIFFLALSLNLSCLYFAQKWINKEVAGFDIFKIIFILVGTVVIGLIL